ncbi:MAG: pyruvate dehydrogenase (acetyl-transferring) E1 component subunit alpha [Bacteroidetes bacterium]|nr:pyruvate dehydrogenase (acetyl-transferring) E1 component subunit alpha [Bacteroidota bacterium]
MEKSIKKYDIKKFDRIFLTGLIEKMCLIRRFEETSAKMYGLKKIGGFLHLYIGQEAVAVGAVSALDLKKDAVFTAYRDHGYAIACGSNIDALMAELFGKSSGISKGKGGSMHFFDVKNHMFGGNGIVGAHIPLAAGYALKISYKNEDGVVLCVFGDGAIHQGTFHETLNIARLWNLPVVFICENNQYGMGTFYKRVSSLEDFTVMAKSYNMTGLSIDGMNVLTVYSELNEIVQNMRKEKNPFFLEIKTYRYKGHSISDPGQYRTKAELEAYKELDPILILKNELLENNIIDQAGYEVIDKKCRDRIDESVRFAENADEPDPAAIYKDVFA